MRAYNCIVVYSAIQNRYLFCKRTKEPYKGKYNVVGGKIEQGEEGFCAAYRELEEETGITRESITLSHMMDFRYYNQDCIIEVYVGVIHEEVILKEEMHPLVWMKPSEDFFSLDQFAGEGNIGHMMEQIKLYGLGIPEV